jgi:hypothetical protein
MAEILYWIQNDKYNTISNTYQAAIVKEERRLRSVGLLRQN